MFLTKNLAFPPIELADEDGLLAIGGDLSIERLKLAYAKGIFPWFNEGEPICWYCPNPRFVLFANQLKISKSLRKVIQSNKFEFRYNTSFSRVINQCKDIERNGQQGTWITSEMENAYIALHKEGIAICAEAWCNGELVGGLYGIKLDMIFCGESMFSLVPNASKFAFVKLVLFLQEQGIKLIDCQIYSSHLAQFGAEMIDMKEYSKYLKN